MSRLAQSMTGLAGQSKARTDAKTQQFNSGLAALAAANQQAMTRIENLLTEANN